MHFLRMIPKKTKSILFIAALFTSTNTLFADPLQDAFTHVYDNKVWDTNAEGEGSSGPGSSESATREYRNFLQNFFAEHNIQSVVDVGCGDWEFSQFINWSGIDYKGYDIVKSVINKNTTKFSAENIQFFHCNTIDFNLPKADLLICKDVLQHLPIEDIKTFLKQLPKYKYCLLTNDFSPNGRTINYDIAPGDYRPIELTDSPFFLHGKYAYEFPWIGHSKHTLLIINN